MTNRTSLQLPDTCRNIARSLTSVPWPADREDWPSADGVASQTIPLFQPHLKPRLRRFLLLCEKAGGLPQEIPLGAAPAPTDPAAGSFSSVVIHTLSECLDRDKYVYRECEARLSIAGRTIGLRMGLWPQTQNQKSETKNFSWWQWGRAERLWAGPLAEAWRIGGHIPAYTTAKPGCWENKGLQDLGEKIAHECGDILHGDLFLIVWKDGCVQITAHFKAGYFHFWPKEIPAFPVLAFSGLHGQWRSGKAAAEDPGLDGREGEVIDLSPSSLMFTSECPATLHVPETGLVVLQPWSDLKVLAHKELDNQLVYMDPSRPEVIPAGVSRSFRLGLGLNGRGATVARYRVPSAWYKACGVIETDRKGKGARMATRSLELIRQYTCKGGFDTGFVWRYLRRDQRLGRPEQDGAEWEGNLGQGLFQLAYQCGESLDQSGELYLHHSYHAADIAIYHGSWMGRLECTTVMTAPLPKFRFGAMVSAYLETGDPYLLEVARSVAGVYMAMEWAHQPRYRMGRDAYPVACLMALWDYTAEPLYLDFARQTIIRLMAAQEEDGGFNGQAGVGTLAGSSALGGKESISFGSGLLAPIPWLEWAIRDNRWTADLRPKLRTWTDLMLRVQPPDGVWLNGGSTGTPYPLIGSAAMFSLVKAGQILQDHRCIEAVGKFLATMEEKNDCVHGTHSFLSALYAHVADAALEEKTPVVGGAA